MNTRRFALAALALPLTLGLAACNQNTDAAATTGGEAIAKIAPPAGKQWTEVVNTSPEGGYVLGNPEAPIKLVEFASLTCSHCAEFAEQGFAELRDTYIASGRVSYEFRNFVRDAIDITAAQLTRCGTTESFFPLTEQVFANQAAIFERAQAAGEGPYQAAMAQPDAKRGIAMAELTGLTEFFAARGIAKDQANACLADFAKAQALAARMEADSTKYDITGTPTFLFNGVKFEENNWPAVKARLEAMGAR